MANRYPPEVHDFIAANVEGRTCKELAELTNREMGTAFTETMMHSYKHNHGLNAENLELHRSGLCFDERELTETGLTLAKLKIKTRERRRK